MVRFIPNPSKLGKKVAAAGGKKLSDAVAEAEANVAELKPAGLIAIDDAIESIAALVRGGALDAEALERIYRLASDIHGSAALFDLKDLGEAGWSLCELIDSGGGAKARTGKAAVSSHLDSLRLLRLGGAVSPEQRRAVLDGLQDLRLHGKQEAPV